MFDHLTEQIQAHALSVWPEESCGLVIDGAYHPKQNIASNPLDAWAIDRKEYPLNGQLQAIVHSHPRGNLAPSKRDMEQQISSGVPWGLVAISSDRHPSNVLWWGNGISVPPLIGRDYRHGPSGSDGRGDCYALIRDYYQTERGITIPEYPRDLDSFAKGENLYEDNFSAAGFERVNSRDLQPGDVVLAQIRCQVTNHGGIYVGKGLWLHHLMDRPSRRDPIVRYQSFITHVLRYRG